MVVDTSSEKNMQQLYAGLMAVPLAVCVKDLKDLRKKMETLDYKNPSSLFEYSGRLSSLEPVVFSCSPEAGAHLEGARQALTSMAYLKEKASNNPVTNMMKSFDFFGMVKSAESAQDKFIKTYAEESITSAIKELEAKS